MSFCLTHIIIISFATKFLFDALENARVTINNKSKFFLSVFMLLTPIIKWGLFDSSHQTLTFLQFTISFYFLVRKYEEFSKVYLLSFILGFLALSNLTFFLPLFFLIFHKINSVDKIFDNAKKLFFTSIVSYSILAWNIFIRSQGYVPYNSATTYWNQFIWVKDFIVSRYENVNLDSRYEYYCMSIPIFLKCYLSDFSKSLLYLFNLLVLILSTYHFIGNREKACYIELLKKLSTVFLVSFVFWSFIGWYPPLRFSLYSLGSFLTLLFCVQFTFIDNIIVKNLSACSYFLYFLFLNHWNFEGIINFNLGIGVSLFITFCIASIRFYDQITNYFIACSFAFLECK